MGAARSLFVANRGEIAVRVIRACRETGLRVVVAAEPGEQGSLAAGLADGVAAVESYLDGAGLVAAALESGCDSLHPGYGYLAESPDFAEAVQRAGLTWIGPPPQAMRLLGDKIEARRLAEAAGSPVVPGYAGVDLSDRTLAREAERLGTPLIVKAAAGGGGRGMRVVERLDDLDEALASARREAEAAFGDARVFLERRLDAARHVEVQVLADAHGHAIHLGERDCSVQRRHQKILEESPSPAVDAELRSALGEAALAIARAAGYVGAGTAEFLLDGEGSWCFLELNARLQVEHPVTEALTGIDLVRAQIEIAGGAPLELDQADVRRVGHAIEARLYAEDPAAGFLPATGRLERLVLPHWPGVRIDQGVRQADEVGVRYDPLLAKIIAHAEDRDSCVDRLAAALRASEVLGVATNLGFLLWTLEHPVFRRGEADTTFVERCWSAAEVPELPEGVHPEPDRADAWSSYGVAPSRPEGVIVEGRHALYRGFAHVLGDDERPEPAPAGPGGSLSAPMPGTVLRVEVEEGDEVDEGATVVVLEAMKMELAVHAPAAGTVLRVHVAAGDLVTRGQALVEVGD